MSAHPVSVSVAPLGLTAPSTPWRGAAALWILIWTGNCLLVAASYGYTADPTGFASLGSLQLGFENTVGAWWSGVLLLGSAILGAAAAIERWSADRTAAVGLAGVATLALGLALDELGSLHERAEHFVPLKGTYALLPFVAAGGCVLLASLAMLWRRRAALPGCWLLVAFAFGLFGSVFAQEYAEHNVDWPTWILPLRVVAEEGTELVGMAILLWAMIRAVRSTGGNASWAALPHAIIALTLVVLAATPALAALRRTLPADAFSLSRGDFGVAPIVLLLALASALAAHRAATSPSKRWFWWAMCVLASALSLETLANLRVFLLGMPLEPGFEGVIGVGVPIAVLALLVSYRRTALAAMVGCIAAVTTALVPWQAVALVTAAVASACVVLAMWRGGEHAIVTGGEGAGRASVYPI